MRKKHIGECSSETHKKKCHVERYATQNRYGSLETMRIKEEQKKTDLRLQEEQAMGELRLREKEMDYKILIAKQQHHQAMHQDNMLIIKVVH